VNATRVSARDAVRTSWLLHASLDNGLPGQSWVSAGLMRDAVDELIAAFGDDGTGRRAIGPTIRR
jgi:hypothetical protein